MKLVSGVYECPGNGGIPQDSGQQVVKVVGNAAGKGAQRFELTGPDKFLIPLLAFGNIADNGDDSRLAMPERPGDGHFYRYGGSFLLADGNLAVIRAGHPFEYLTVELYLVRKCVRRYIISHAFLEQFLNAPACHFGNSPVGIDGVSAASRSCSVLSTTRFSSCSFSKCSSRCIRMRSWFC